MAAISTDLPSRVEETLAACPQFRILVIGKSGVGKSSLVSNIFNIAVKDIDIRHDRAGNADISYGYTSTKNIRFILHDSLGFEPGTVNHWKIVEDFLRQRSTVASQLQDRVHAIW
ncbi:hypothetical protein BYT27DRAFT_7108363 [Phlegmacium glaucopus]|nr:hypothetical protein BYT27DRAFT_7108363 [Phlegmacium glaucopus]